jgi:flagellar basal body L-ring protein FlgH
MFLVLSTLAFSGCAKKPAHVPPAPKAPAAAPKVVKKAPKAPKKVVKKTTKKTAMVAKKTTTAKKK